MNRVSTFHKGLEYLEMEYSQNGIESPLYFLFSFKLFLLCFQEIQKYSRCTEYKKPNFTLLMGIEKNVNNYRIVWAIKTMPIFSRNLKTIIKQ